MTLEVLGWWVMAAIAVACAVGMVSARNPVHSALWLVANFVALAVIYLILSAPMLFAIQMIVYAGAIMVLFLFVVMFFMAPAARTWLRPPLKGQLVIGGILVIAFIMLLMLGLSRSALAPVSAETDTQAQAFDQQQQALREEAEAQRQMGQPLALGKWLFTYHVLPFELTSLLLLAALLGAVMLARDVPSEGRVEFEEFAPTVHEEGAAEVAD